MDGEPWVLNAPCTATIEKQRAEPLGPSIGATWFPFQASDDSSFHFVSLTSEKGKGASWSFYDVKEHANGKIEGALQLTKQLNQLQP